MTPARGLTGAQRRRARRSEILRASLALSLGALAAVLVACGSSGKSLIPAARAGPLLSDFEAVREAAEKASGNCSTTESALKKTEEDLAALPSSVDGALRNNLRQGLANLRVRAREMCAQPVAQPTLTTTVPKTTSTTTTTPTQTTPTETQSTPTQTTPTQTTTGAEGGTPAPQSGEAPAAPGGGTGAGEGATKAPQSTPGAGGVGDGQGEQGTGK